MRSSLNNTPSYFFFTVAMSQSLFSSAFTQSRLLQMRTGHAFRQVLSLCETLQVAQADEVSAAAWVAEYRTHDVSYCPLSLFRPF
jgi:hypothetical protein